MSIETHDIEAERYEFEEAPRYVFTLTRRAFLQAAGVGLMIAAVLRPGAFGTAFAQSERAVNRLHIGTDGMVTVFTGKVEVGQGARSQIAQAAAEELRLPMAQIRVVMSDTDLVPDDGGTYGSLTTPRTVPQVRQAAAAAREILIDAASKHWGAEASLDNGVFTASGGRTMTLAELVNAVAEVDEAAGAAREGGDLTPYDAWQTLGTAPESPNARAIVIGAHRYVSDIQREGMVYGAVLRPPVYGAELESLDAAEAEAMDGVTVVRDGAFVGCTAPTRYHARKAVEALARHAKWSNPPQPAASDGLAAYLQANTREGSGRSRGREDARGDVDGAFSAAAQTLEDTYSIPFIQHAPMETRSAVAEWSEGRLTVWAGTQRPFDVRGELAEAFGMAEDKVRLIMPDTGGGFGGKHRGDAAIEAARLALAVEKPVSLQWTREEEFMWAYFRPAGVMTMRAALDPDGAVTAWEHVNYNAGTSSLGCPYAFPAVRTRFQPCASPLREGSYRGLAATANTFAREAFVDRLAKAAGKEPLAFRLAHLEDERLRNVLTAAANRFGWSTAPEAGVHYGIACGAEKGSVVATCAEVAVDAAAKTFTIRRLCTAFECGAVLNPQNTQAQVDGSVVMGLGSVLGEAIRFANGALLNGRFKDYAVPRFKDVPPMETVLVNRPDLPSVGSGETPIVAVAPAVANALFAATGAAPTELPLRIA